MRNACGVCMPTKRDFVKFLHELGQLKNVPRSGWQLIGIKQPESVAEHSLRAAQIAYLIALERKADAEHAAALCVFHDLPEARIGDVHKVAARYGIGGKGAESRVVREQAQRLPKGIAEKYSALYSEYCSGKTEEAKIAHDAELLECAFQAWEYIEQGFPAKEWVRRVGARLKLPEAKSLWRAMQKGKPSDWWKGLKTSVEEEARGFEQGRKNKS